jgi:hypothetical protein
LQHLTACTSFPPCAAGGLLSVRAFSTEPDSHDDFKPQVKAAAAGSVEAVIEEDISSHDVFLYMKVRLLNVLHITMQASSIAYIFVDRLHRWTCSKQLLLVPLPLPLPPAGCAASAHVRLQQHGVCHPKPVW